MNVNTLVITQETALQKLDQYRTIQGRRRLAEDDKLEELYLKISRGARVINIAEAFKYTGLNERGQPRLAIARADWQGVHFFPRREIGDSWYGSGVGNGGFSAKSEWFAHNKLTNLVLPRGTFDNSKLADKRLRSPVPHIPPDCRPKFKLSNYHVLFEVQKWEAYPVDPFLLRRISGMLFIVEAEWELSPVEAELLASMR